MQHLSARTVCPATTRTAEHGHRANARFVAPHWVVVTDLCVPRSIIEFCECRVSGQTTLIAAEADSQYQSEDAQIYGPGAIVEAVPGNAIRQGRAELDDRELTDTLI